MKETCLLEYSDYFNAVFTSHESDIEWGETRWREQDVVDRNTTMVDNYLVCGLLILTKLCIIRIDRNRYLQNTKLQITQWKLRLAQERPSLKVQMRGTASSESGEDVLAVTIPLTLTALDLWYLSLPTNNMPQAPRLRCQRC